MSPAEKFVACVGCGALVPDQPGPTHRYMTSSPGCWEIYGQVLAREYTDRAYASLHRLTVDAYAVQHPGTSSPQSIQSVGIHLLRLHLVLERGFSDAAAARVMPLLSRQKGRFHWLLPPPPMGGMTAVDVWRTSSTEQHRQAVMEWAQAAWQAWAPHHDQVRCWLPKELRQS